VIRRADVVQPIAEGQTKQQAMMNHRLTVGANRSAGRLAYRAEPAAWQHEKLPARQYRQPVGASGPANRHELCPEPGRRPDATASYKPSSLRSLRRPKTAAALPPAAPVSAQMNAVNQIASQLPTPIEAAMEMIHGAAEGAASATALKMFPFNWRRRIPGRRELAGSLPASKYADNFINNVASLGPKRFQRRAGVVNQLRKAGARRMR